MAICYDLYSNHRVAGSNHTNLGRWFMTLKPIEKNGDGRYKANASGIVLSLGGVVAAVAFSVASLITLGEYKRTLEWTTSRAATAIKRQHDFERETNQRLLRMELAINKIQTILYERTSKRDIYYAPEYLDDSI